MTNRDILVQILSEASGKPKEQVSGLVEVVYSNIPKGKLDQELPDDKAKTLLASLRTQLPGVLRWLAEGADMARKDWGLP